MPALTLSLRKEYDTLFNTCDIRADRAKEVESLVTRILGNKPRYDLVRSAVGVPWHVVGAIHCMEGGLNFGTHLHNGDPLTARTVHVPAGRPKDGQPPFTWDFSAADALRLAKLDRWTDWSVAGTLFQLELYNGWGYRLKNTGVNTPYLWSYSNHYTKGKFVADGTYNPDSVSRQCGAAALLRRMAEKDPANVAFATTPAASGPLDKFGQLRYSLKETPGAAELQQFLNQFPGVFVRVDGKPGPMTSDAFRKVTGHYLLGDPRA